MLTHHAAKEARTAGSLSSAGGTFNAQVDGDLPRVRASASPSKLLVAWDGGRVVKPMNSLKKQVLFSNSSLHFLNVQLLFRVS